MTKKRNKFLSKKKYVKILKAVEQRRKEQSGIQKLRPSIILKGDSK